MQSPEQPTPVPSPAASSPTDGSAAVIPRDGGTMLGAAAVFGLFSFLSRLDSVHLGSGAIPLWVPLAVDTAIAAAAGTLLTVGGRWFPDDEDSPPAAGDSVVVSRTAWESIQHEVLAARGVAPPPPRIPQVAPPPAPRPATTAVAAPTISAAAAEPVPDVGPNPWDEGPPTPAAPSPPAPAAPAPVSPALRRARELTRPSGPADLSADEIEEIARMGGILGVVPRPGETGREYAERLSKIQEAGGEATSGRVEPAATPAAPSGAPPATADIDELMGLLDQVAAEPWGSAPGPRAKKRSETGTQDPPESPKS